MLVYTFLFLFISWLPTLSFDEKFFIDYSNISDSKNYTCEELKRWLGSEKHYSNPERRKYFFSFLTDDTECKLKPYVSLSNMTFGFDTLRKKSRSSYKLKDENRKCKKHDNKAVILLSNFSIKHNFSHFLHALLRLFCSLIDANYIKWNSMKTSFYTNQNYTLWLDEYLPMSEMHLSWYSSLTNDYRILKETPKGDCYSSDSLLYGNGCARLLPPEKWFGLVKNIKILNINNYLYGVLFI